MAGSCVAGGAGRWSERERRRSRQAALACALAGAALLVPACSSSHERPGGLASGFTSSSGGGDGGSDGFDAGIPDGPAPCPDTQGLCACEVVQAIADAPNLYFVLDSSGSMGRPSGVGGSRYDAVRDAVIELVRGLGPLIRVGAALFPTGESCSAGDEVFPVTDGDPISGEDGPTTTGFAEAIDRSPNGGTPTSATLLALTPGLSGLPGRTVVLLATDGAPGCNDGATCDAADCMANIEASPQCDPDTNCCAADAENYGPSFCVDRAATVAAIAAIAAGGIPVYVIGIPGSEAYESTLDDMAAAGGGTPPEGGGAAYYRVDDLGALGSILGKIASIAVSCQFDLGSEPPDKALTNVYLDKQLLPHDPVSGWEWTSDTALELRGDACTRLKEGQVKQVQIVAGCPTEGPL